MTQRAPFTPSSIWSPERATICWPGSYTQLAAFRRVLDHRAWIVGRDDHGVAFVHDAAQRQAGRFAHRARVEASDLIVVEIGGDEARGGEIARDRARPRGVHALLFEPRAV